MNFIIRTNYLTFSFEYQTVSVCILCHVLIKKAFQWFQETTIFELRQQHQENLALISAQLYQLQVCWTNQELKSMLRGLQIVMKENGNRIYSSKWEFYLNSFKLYTLMVKYKDLTKVYVWSKWAKKPQKTACLFIFFSPYLEVDHEITKYRNGNSGSSVIW